MVRGAKGGDRRARRTLWLDLGTLGVLVDPPSDRGELAQDHGMGLLRTILHRNGVEVDMISTRAFKSWRRIAKQLAGYDQLLMNVRSYTYPIARTAAELFKRANPDGLVIVGGVHATVAPEEMEAVEEFDRICQGPGEGVIVDLVKDPLSFPRVVSGSGPKSMADWPRIDRTLWPKPAGRKVERGFPWPLEARHFDTPPVATMLTSRTCPWRCSFCNESSYMPAMGRRPVDSVIEELNDLDEKYGPLGSVVFHDSMFFQSPGWLREWLEKYPRKARRTWPYWAAGRADTVRQWPDLFEALVRETNWSIVSIGFESGSDRVLKILNKECTEEDNRFAIDLLHRIGDDLERQGRRRPIFFANIMLGIPGETREDAFKTMRMVKRIDSPMVPISFFAPYPGSALGYQVIAEGKSLMSKDGYHRASGDEKMAGIDYAFYKDLLAGKYDHEIDHGVVPSVRRREERAFETTRRRVRRALRSLRGKS